MVRYAVEDLLPMAVLPTHDGPLASRIVQREVDRVQRIAEGQGSEIRKTQLRYSAILEEQRSMWQEYRSQVLNGSPAFQVLNRLAPDHVSAWRRAVGVRKTAEVARAIMLYEMDRHWREHLADVQHVREGIHLVGIGGLDPLAEYQRVVAEAFLERRRSLEPGLVAAFHELDPASATSADVEARFKGPGATWTYLVNDRALNDVQETLFGKGNIGMAAGALMTWPLLALWGRLGATQESKAVEP